MSDTSFSVIRNQTNQAGLILGSKADTGVALTFRRSCCQLLHVYVFLQITTLLCGDLRLYERGVS